MTLDVVGDPMSANTRISHTAQILWRHGGVGVLDVIPISWVSHPRFQTDMVVGHLASLRLDKNGCRVGCKSWLVSACGKLHLLVSDDAHVLWILTLAWISGASLCIFADAS